MRCGGRGVALVWRIERERAMMEGGVGMRDVIFR